MNKLKTLSLGLLALALSGCSGGGVGGPTAVSIEVFSDNSMNRSSRILACASDAEASGSYADSFPDAAEKACDALTQALTDKVFETVDANTACTDIYGGPWNAKVKGTIEGTQVESEFSQKNGCEISRWDKLADVFAPLTSDEIFNS